MSDRPTPETDETHRLNCLPSTPEDTAYHYVLNLSRRLERERDEAREKLATERALADKLAQWMVDQRANWTDGMQTNQECGCDDCLYLRPLDELIAAWKEARK